MLLEQTVSYLTSGHPVSLNVQTFSSWWSNGAFWLDFRTCCKNSEVEKSCYLIIKKVDCCEKFHVPEGREQPWAIFATGQFFKQPPLLLHFMTSQTRYQEICGKWRVKNHVRAVSILLSLSNKKKSLKKQRERDRRETKEKVFFFKY